MEIGEMILKKRQAAGMTQERLGEKLGVTNKNVFRWENGSDRRDFEA